jgi:cobalt-zinc-cadmium resistance protein CzcA
MLDKIILFSIRNKLIVAMCTLALIVWGLWSAIHLPIDAVPDITNNQVQIITVCPTLASQEVEQLVTYPIEQTMANLPDLEELRSVSRFGLSVITIVFKEEVDIYFGRQLINERLREAAAVIPEGIGTPELAPVSTGLGEVYQYIIHPKPGSENKYTAMDLRVMQDWIVARQLYGTAGIAEVNSFGGHLKQYEVSIDPDRLLAMDVTIPEIFTALEKNNANTGGSYIDKKPNAYYIRSVGLLGSFKDIESIVIKTNSKGLPLLIKDVAEVKLGSAVRYGAQSYNGDVEAVGGVVMMLKGANSAEVVERIKLKMESIRKSLPEDIIIEPYLDRTDLVNRAIHTVERNLLEGALIVIFVLVIFLGNLRAGLIVASAIPLSMLFALGMMSVFNVSANLMSLGAIDFGLIVDGAVIIVEATMHHLGLRKSMGRLSQAEMDEEVYKSASRIRNSAAFGEIIILIVYIPILTLIGIEGKMFRPMAQTVGFAILGALILSLTYIPMMCALFLPKLIKPHISFSDRLMAFFQKIYTPLLEFAIRFKTILISITVVVFILSLFVFKRLGGEFIPTLQEGDYAFHCILPQGTSLSQSLETSMQACKLLTAFDEVKMVVGKTGSAEVPTDPMPPEATDMVIVLKPQKEWKRNITYDQLADEFMDSLAVMPGVFFEKSQPIQMRFNELMTGIRQDVAVKIYGENLDTLLAYANQVSEVIQQVEGATAPSVERVEGLPQIVIRYDRNRIAGYGLNIKDINQIISTSFAGGHAGEVFENERRFDLVVRLDSAKRQEITDVNRLFIPIANGSQIPLSQVADVRFELGPAQISREDGQRRIVVGFNVQGRDVQSVVKDIQQNLGEQIRLPEGYYFSYGGTFENLEAASKRLMVAVPVALVLIFILLYFTFNSFRQAALIYTAIPMGAIGGVFALVLRDMPFSISAGVGFIALFGVSVLNGIVLIASFNHLAKEGIIDPLQRIREGTRIRLRPVLMTATVASLGFLPMALSHGAGAEVQKPLATVVIGGLITSTALTLFILPLLYLIFSKPIRMYTSIKSASVILLLLCAGVVTGQVPLRKLSLDEAIQRTLENNLLLESKEHRIEASKAMTSLGYELPPTSFLFQYGQFNSFQNDNYFSVGQSLPWPGYFNARNKMYHAQVKEYELGYEQNVLDIKTMVRVTYDKLVYVEFVLKEIYALDSLYAEMARIAEQRYLAGEGTLLAKSAAALKTGEIKVLATQYEADYEVGYALIKKWTAAEDEFTIALEEEYRVPADRFIFDSALVANHPIVASLQQASVVAAAEVHLQRNANAPDIQAGYFNQSLIGFQNIDGNDVYYDGSKRFQGFNIGLNIPIFYTGNKAKVESLSAKQLAAEKELAYNKEKLQLELYASIRQYQQHLAQYEYYTSNALPHSNQLLDIARTGYTAGESGYLEYLNALQFVSDTRLRYLETIHQLHQNNIQIQYLIQQ